MDSSAKTPWYKKVDNGIMHFEHTIMAICMIAMSIIVFVNVVLRYTINFSFIWAEEVSRQFAVWVCFVGASACVRFGAHVCVDIIPMRLKGKAKKIHTFIVDLIAMGATALLAYMGIARFILAWTSGNISITTGIPVWLVYMAPMIGFVLSLYEYVKITVKSFLEINKPEKKEGEGAC